MNTLGANAETEVVVDTFSQPTPISVWKLTPTFTKIGLIVWSGQAIPFGLDGDATPASLPAELEALEQFFASVPDGALGGVCLRAVARENPVSGNGGGGDPRSVSLKDSSKIVARRNLSALEAIDANQIISWVEDYMQYLAENFPGSQFDIEVLPNTVFPLSRQSYEELRESIGDAALRRMEDWGMKTQGGGTPAVLLGTTAVMAGVRIGRVGGVFRITDLDVPDESTLENIHYLVPSKGLALTSAADVGPNAIWKSQAEYEASTPSQHAQRDARGSQPGEDLASVSRRYRKQM